MKVWNAHTSHTYKIFKAQNNNKGSLENLIKVAYSGKNLKSPPNYLVECWIFQNQEQGLTFLDWILSDKQTAVELIKNYWIIPKEF